MLYIGTTGTIANNGELKIIRLVFEVLRGPWLDALHLGVVIGEHGVC